MKASRLRLRITAAAESEIRSGHPWLFAESIREQNRDGETGELAVIYDRKNRFLALGLFDPESPLRVRVLHQGKPQTIDRRWWERRLEQALARRSGLFDDQTTGYRWINGESDGWPGLVLDRYDTALVLKLYTAAWLPRLEAAVDLIRERLKPERVVLRLSRNIQATAQSRFKLAEGPLPSGGKRAGNSLNQPGTTPPLTPALPMNPPTPDPSQEGSNMSSAPRQFPSREGSGVGPEAQSAHKVRRILDSERASADPGRPAAIFSPQGAASFDQDGVTFLETGLRFEADILRGQKTGFFLDQRENRRIVESLARGRDLLNAFSFSGAFSIYAARGGARSATDLDISAHALESAKRNFARNQTQANAAACRHETIQTDAFEWLAGNAGRTFDLVILDPPSLAQRELERFGAIQAYRGLASAGIQRLKPGGILVASSCSAHVSAEEFFGAVRQAASQSGRAFTRLQTTGHPPDHPATFAEANYLKCIYLRFG